MIKVFLTLLYMEGLQPERHYKLMLNYNLKLFSHNELFNDFVNLDLLNKLPSKILLTGNEGTGKCTFALHFINYLFSKNETSKYNLSKNTINPESKSYNLINNLKCY